MNEDRKMKEEFLANRKAAGRVIDVETCEIAQWWVQILDPYGVEPDLPDEMQCVGRTPSSDPLKAMVGCLCTICRRTRPARCTAASNAESEQEEKLPGSRKTPLPVTSLMDVAGWGQIEEVCHEPTD